MKDEKEENYEMVMAIIKEEEKEKMEHERYLDEMD
jgi:hypothetical protein